MRIDSSGVALDVQVEGRGRPVVLLHGFPDTKRLWSKQVPALVDAGFQVIVPDQRGYGASDKPTELEAYSIPFLAIDVTAILDHLGIERAHVVGHDWGSAVAWATAAFAPERVDHLVALSVGHPTAFSTVGMPQREKSWYMLLFQFRDIAEQWLTMHDWANFREWSKHPDVDAVIADLQRDNSLTPGLGWYRANIPPQALIDPPLELPTVQAPTMGVWSSGDFALLEEQMTGSSKYCANSFRYERIEGPGHWMQWEAPEKVNALLLDFSEVADERTRGCGDARLPVTTLRSLRRVSAGISSCSAAPASARCDAAQAARPDVPVSGPADGERSGEAGTIADMLQAFVNERRALEAERDDWRARAIHAEMQVAEQLAAIAEERRALEAEQSHSNTEDSDPPTSRRRARGNWLYDKG